MTHNRGAYFLVFTTIAFCALQLEAQLNCSGGPLGCPQPAISTGLGSTAIPTFAGVTISTASPDQSTTATTGTNRIFQRYINTGGSSIFGSNGSSAAGVFTSGGVAYATVIFNTSTNPIQFGHTNAEVTIADGGATTFGSSVTAGASSAVTITAAQLQIRGNSVLLDGLPTCSGGGCVMAAASTNTAMNFTTTTTGAVDITVTFSTAWSNAPSCFANNDTTGNLLRVTTVVVGSIHVQGVTVAGDTLRVGCFGN